MKYTKIICCILAVCLLFTGCSFRLASSIDDLISPISPFGENAHIQKAMDSFVKSGYSLKTPSHGDYITSYIFTDLDGDQQEEAISFYEPSDDLGTTYMAVLKNIDNDWSVVTSIKGEGKDIYSLDFCDMNGDSKSEIVACWDVISNSSSHNLAVYNYTENDGEFFVNAIGDYITVNNYTFTDFNADKNEELLAFIITDSHSAKAELYNMKGSKLTLNSETKLDSNITTYTNICQDNVDGTVRVYADAIKSNGSSMVTELIYWSNRYDSIVSPFYSYSTGLTKGTTRSAMATCRDIDGDSVAEIPMDATISSLPKQVDAIDWKIYSNSVLMHSNYSLFVQNDGYFLIIPDDEFDNISVKYDDENRILTVNDKSSKKLMFTITPVLKSLYNKSDYQNQEIVLEYSGYYYLASVGENSAIELTQLKELIKSY